MKKDFLSISDMSKDEAYELLDLAKEFKKKPLQSILKGKTLGMLFTKSSTRTRVSFEVGIFQLGGYAIFLEPQTLQIGRGETLEDTSRVLSQYLDGMVIRTFEHKDLECIAEAASIPVINGLTDSFHPCQIMCDLFTIQEKRGILDDLHVVYVGDGCNNIAHSWVVASAIIGFNLTVVAPQKYWPDPTIVRGAMKLAQGRTGFFNTTQDAAKAVTDADVIYTDVWVSMGQEKDTEKKIKELSGYQINHELISKAKIDTLVMHCLPAHRGEEITAQVMDHPQAIIFEQAQNRLHMQKAIMATLMGRNR